MPDDARYRPLGQKAMLRRIGLRGLDPALFERPKSGLSCRSIAGSGAA